MSPPPINPIQQQTKRKQKISLVLKRIVWEYHVGNSVGQIKCPCCKITDIFQMSFVCGHIISEHNGGMLTKENLKPICQSCNSSMGTINMNEFIDNLHQSNF